MTSLSLLTLLATSCGGGGAGPCVHLIEDPLVRILLAQGRETSSRIETPLHLFDFYLDGLEVADVGSVLNPNPLSSITTNITVSGDTLQCTTPCSFGSMPGEYRFSVSAQEYRPDTVQLVAEHAGSEGGCPSRSFGGTQEVIIELSR